MHSMRRHAGRLALCLALMLSWAAPLAAFERQDAMRLAGSVLRVHASRVQGGSSMGSGVLVADERVVTNCHVTREAREIVVIRWGERWPASAQAIDAEHDLCVLQVDGLRGSQVAQGRAGALQVGQRVIALGYTGGFGLQGSDGDVVALHRFDGAPVIQATNRFSSGASGGGLFDERGRLVGILTFRMRGGEVHYFAAPIEWVERQLLPGARYEPIGPIDATRLAYWQRPDGRQPEFLQAVSLTYAARWPELRELSLQWVRGWGLDPYPWHSQGVAEERLERLREAQASFARSVALDPRFATGWLSLGLVSARLGEMDTARHALRVLDAMGSRLAPQLAERLRTSN